jgi:hypothetical protein
MTEPNKQCVEGEVSINEVNGETIPSESSAVTPPSATLKRPPVKDPTNRLDRSKAECFQGYEQPTSTSPW